MRSHLTILLVLLAAASMALSGCCSSSKYGSRQSCDDATGSCLPASSVSEAKNRAADGDARAFCTAGESLSESRDEVEDSEDAARENASALKYRISLYSGGSSVRHWDASGYSFGDGMLYIYLPGKRPYVAVSGTYSIEPVKTVPIGSGTGGVKVTLYSNGKAVGTWEATRYSVNGEKMLFYLPGVREAFVVSGTCVVEPIK